ncbi:tyrosine-type recombinase/integrase [Natronorubrum aibiense]|uniref:Tyrosine-type recombinase/integrase n=1 Tax=Natronorubrum aibiense TaxID=348826 RepID=A0A5P9P9P5_9EURY|nr:site-specific integrase [Natronorubrum aibiense]QFU84822.1 tyrosine-type recombinase/integrase [Natronorubrum aibiense]
MDPSNSAATPGGHPLETTIDDFLESGNKAGNYRDALERVLTQWRQRLEQRDIETVEEIDKRTMASYAQYLSRRVDAGKSRTVDGGITAATAWTYYDYVSSYLSYCVRWDYLEENPAQKGIALDELPPRPTNKSGDQQFWSVDDRQALLRYVDDRAHRAVDERGTGALEELRDRALSYVLAYSGVRGGEILADPRDERRNGLRWQDVDLENNQLLVLGKNQQFEEAQLPAQCHGPLERLETALEPSSPEWPVFVTSHAPSLYGVLPDDVDPSAGEPLELCRSHDIVPPSLSTNGGRSVLKRLCDEVDLEVDGEYLKPHGARRGVGEAVYRERGPAAAQRALRHADPRTTSEMYAHIEASELAEEVGDVFENE